MKMISPDRVQLGADEARTLGINALVKTGFDEEQAGVISEHVLDAALCGYEYSGLPKLLNVIEHPNLHQPRRRLNIVHETPVSAMVDGGNLCGMYTLMRAAESNSTWPPTAIRPASGFKRPEMALATLVLPEPDGPMMAT